MVAHIFNFTIQEPEAENLCDFKVILFLKNACPKQIYPNPNKTKPTIHLKLSLVFYVQHERKLA